jgi:predicted CXXCH cytochrome family protein
MSGTYLNRKGGLTVKHGNRSLLTKHSIIMALFIFSCITTVNQARAADPSVGNNTSKNEACMGCHSDQGTVGIQNYINPINFGQTSHAELGCKACHETIASNHPDGGKSAASKTTCGDCHGDIKTQYSASIHATKASCNGCHNPHSVYTAAESTATGMNKQCAGCHDNNKITASHSKWLPQAGLHLGAIACVTCHSKAENYVINIYIAKLEHFDSESKPSLVPYEILRKYTNDDNIQYLIDTNHDNVISLDELRKFNSNSSSKNLYLKAMMTPVKPTHSFQTFDNRWNCTFCHASGPEIMQTSFLSLPEPNGAFRHVAVEKGAALDALKAVPNFYLMGSTRNGILNYIGLLIIVCGMIMPIGHGFFRFLSIKNRQ